jgi:hypothetical protein
MDNAAITPQHLGWRPTYERTVGALCKDTYGATGRRQVVNVRVVGGRDCWFIAHSLTGGPSSLLGRSCATQRTKLAAPTGALGLASLLSHRASSAKHLGRGTATCSAVGRACRPSVLGPPKQKAKTREIPPKKRPTSGRRRQSTTSS